jgi:AraC-like DNA-binding protein
LARLSHFVHTDFALGIGDWAYEPEQIHASYKQAKQALRYAFVFGRRTAIAYSRICERTEMLENGGYEQLGVAVKAGNEQRASQLLDQFLARVQDNPIDIDAVELALVQQVTVLSQAILELGMHPIFPYSEMMKEYRKQTLEATIDWFKQLCARIAEELKAHSNQHHYRLMTELKRYMDTHLQDDISLDDLSKQAGLSSSYVSYLFKEMLQISFTDYLNQARLRAASRLLIEERKAAVAEISERVGYRNVQYFITKFKHQYGITPAQYRKTASFSTQEAPIWK